jgi:mRNA interferase RelE/StbE
MEGLRLLYHHDIPDDVAAIPRNIRNIIHRAIDERLASDPLRFGEPLRRSLQGYRKLRVGDYRVVYRIAGHDVIVLKIGHRKDVYGKAEKRVE